MVVEGAIRSGALSTARWAEALPALDLASACHTSHVGRAHLEHRRAYVSGSSRELASALAGQGLAPSPLEAGVAGTVWLFTGQGSQEQGMGMELYNSSDVAKEVWDRADKYLMNTYGKITANRMSY